MGEAEPTNSVGLDLRRFQDVESPEPDGCAGDRLAVAYDPAGDGASAVQFEGGADLARRLREICSRGRHGAINSRRR